MAVKTEYGRITYSITDLSVLVKFSFCLMFSAASLFLQAQSPDAFKQTIRGTVVDADTKSPLIGANISIANTDPFLGAVTDVDGNFKIDQVPVGRHTVQISYLGYENQVLSNQLIGSGKQLILNIELTESIKKLQEVVVTAGADNKAAPINEMAMVSAQSFSVEETKRFAAGVSDPARMITAFAGATANGGDDNNAIIIRGNSPRGLLWRLEGVEIPNPNHFASEGASSGGISILSANTLANSDFYTGAFPAEFGNALSGAFDIRLRNGNDEKREYTFQAGILGVEAAVEGPFKKGGSASYLVNYRYSTLALFTKLGINIVDEDEETTYQDAAFKLNFPTKKAGIFSVYGIGGLSEDIYQPSGDTYSEDLNTNMGAVGLNHLIRVNDKSFLRSNISYSGTEVINDANNSSSDYRYIESKKKSYLRFNSKLRTKFNARNIVETGFVYSRLAYNFTEREVEPFRAPPFNDYLYLDEKGNSGSWQGYASWKFRINEELSLINGLHLLYFELNKKATIEPRSALKWQFTPTQSFGLGFGMHSRIESLEYYLSNYTDADGNVTQPNKDLGFTKARHYVLSYDNLLSRNWYIKAETYYQELYNVPVHDNENSIFSTLLLEDDYTTLPLVNEGTGTNYGLELTAQRFFDKGFYMLFSGSLYEATYEALDDVTRNTPFGSNFSFSFLTGKEYLVGRNDQNILGLNFRGAWGGNRRFVPIDIEASRMAFSTIYDFENSFEDRLPDYWKLDMQVSLRTNKKKVTKELRLDILNLTNRENVASEYFNASTGNTEYDTQTGIIPVLSFRVEF